MTEKKKEDMWIDYWTNWSTICRFPLQPSWNLIAHGDAREGKWMRNWRIEWVASTLHTTSEHGVSSITTADAHTSAASSRLNWRLCRFKWTRPFRRKTKSGFCACAITFQTQSTVRWRRWWFHKSHGILKYITQITGYILCQCYLVSPAIQHIRIDAQKQQQ